MRHVTETGSTNADLIAAIDDGIVGDRTVLVADHQTAGRGRLERRWEAPPGANLLVSFAFTVVPDVPAELTQRVGLAAVDAARTIDPGSSIRLKWPNDVLLNGRKLAGILAQRAAGGGVVVGLGFNIAWAPQGAARLAAAVTPAAVLAAMLAAFDALPPDVGERYRSELSTIGSDVRVELPAGRELTGTATGVDGSGRLIVVDDAGRRHHLDVGDVVHVSPS